MALHSLSTGLSAERLPEMKFGRHRITAVDHERKPSVFLFFLAPWLPSSSDAFTSRVTLVHAKPLSACSFCKHKLGLVHHLTYMPHTCTGGAAAGGCVAPWLGSVDRLCDCVGVAGRRATLLRAERAPDGAGDQGGRAKTGRPRPCLPPTGAARACRGLDAQEHA
eukprot:5509810-Pleurochrysis_carterae.AAC.4